jgi:hypothetical protein
MATRRPHQVGDVLKHDFQADVFEGEYRLVEDLGGGSWLAETVEPSDELIEAARVYYLEGQSPCLNYVDPFGPGRRRATRQESLDMEILERIERAGWTFKIQFTSRAKWAEMF